MYQDRKTNRIGILLCLLLVLAAAFYGVRKLRTDVPQELEEDSIASIRRTVQQSALQCYAVEGVYPPDIAYLQDNYGLRINTGAYIVAYEAYAENQMPYIKVVKRNR